MPSIRLTGDIAHIMEGTRAQAADLNLTLAEDGFPDSKRAAGSADGGGERRDFLREPRRIFPRADDARRAV